MVRGLALQQWTNYNSNKYVPTCIYPLSLVLLLYINLILPDIVLSFVPHGIVREVAVLKVVLVLVWSKLM